MKTFLIPKIKTLGARIEKKNYSKNHLSEIRYSHPGLFLIVGEDDPEAFFRIMDNRVIVIKKTGSRFVPDNINRTNVLGLCYYGTNQIDVDAVFQNHIHLTEVIFDYQNKNERFSILNKEMFSGCKNLSKVQVYGNTDIPLDCFNGCNSLSSLSITGEVNSIEENAFVHCENLINLELKSVEHIEDCAFSYSAIEKLIVSMPSENFKIKYALKDWGIVRKEHKGD